MLDRTKYRFEYDDLDWNQIKEAFPVKSVLEDYMGIPVKGNRCACPMHQGKNLSMQVFDTAAKCYSKCQDSFSAFDLVKYNDNLDSTYDAILHLCDFYNIDPLSFDGITAADGSMKPEAPKKNPIPLSKAQLDFMDLRVNPFTRHTVQIKTGEKTHVNTRGKTVVTPILEKKNLTDQECAWIMMQGIKNFTTNGNIIFYNMKQYLYSTQMLKEDGLFLIDSLKSGLTWYKDVANTLNEIGIKEPENKEEVLSQYFSEQNTFYMDYPEANSISFDKQEMESTEHLSKDYEIDYIDLLHACSDAQKEPMKVFLRQLGISSTLPKKSSITDEFGRPITLYANKDEYLLNVKERLMKHKIQTIWVSKAIMALNSVSKPDNIGQKAFQAFDNILYEQMSLTLDAEKIMREEYSRDEHRQLEPEEEIER